MPPRPKLPDNPVAQNDLPAWYDTLAQRYPTIASFLAPADPERPGGKPQPGMTLMISDFKGALQFSVGVRGEKEMWAGPVDAADSLLEAIEVRLRSGSVTRIVLKR